MKSTPEVNSGDARMLLITVLPFDSTCFDGSNVALPLFFEYTIFTGMMYTGMVVVVFVVFGIGADLGEVDRLLGQVRIAAVPLRDGSRGRLGSQFPVVR